MRNLLRKISVSVGRGHGSWLTLLLLLAVLVPSACLLWFMRQAMRNERLAVRQKLVEAYRGQLTLASQNLATNWQRSAAEWDQQAETLSAPALFARQVHAGTADAVLCYAAAGNLLYPNSAPVPAADWPGADWSEAQRLEVESPGAAAEAYARLAAQETNAHLAARAVQAQVRCLVRADHLPDALAVLASASDNDRFRNATDAQGRLIVPNLELMAIDLLKDSDPARAQIFAERLRRRLLDYDDPALAAPQRRFLMRALQNLSPREAPFPNLAAEDLAARYVAAGPVRFRDAVLRPGNLPGTWQFGSPHHRVVMLYLTEHLTARMRTAASESAFPPGVRMEFIPPGQEAEASLTSIPAGSEFPGWRIALSLPGRQLFDSASNARISAYVWTGALAVGTVIVLAALALGLVRRQAALTRLRNDLVANVTHELKTPLASMRLFVDTLLDSPKLHEPTTREYLELIARENARLSRLIDNFLTFSRIERNKCAFEFKEISAATIVEGAAAAVRERFNAPDCCFDVRVEDGLPSVVADADAMITALLNLLDNAYKYSGDNKEIALGVAAENGCVIFTVKDNGIGLSGRDAKRIFKRFYQVNHHFKSAGGCGLGLSIVQFVVTAHRGTVRVDSQPGQGSTFVVTLPAAGADARTKP